MFRIPLLLVLALALGAWAQQAPKASQAPKRQAPKAVLPPLIPNSKWTIDENAVQLAVQPSVALELKLTRAELTDLSQIYVELDKKWEELSQAHAEDAAFDAAGQSANDKALAVLTPTERRRLRQLGIQAMGFEAFRLTDVRKTLALSSAQTAALDSMFKEYDAQNEAYQTELADRISAISDPGVKATEEQRIAYNKAQEAVVADLAPKQAALVQLASANRDKILVGLSIDQTKAWQDLSGPPFKVD